MKSSFYDLIVDNMINVTLQQKEACLFELHIHLPSEDFQQKKKEVINLYRRSVNIPGFRKGKAPDAAIERKYATEVKEETIDRLMRSSLQEALKEQEFQLLEYPQMKDINLNEANELSYVAVVTVRPEIELPTYEDIRIDVTKKEADDVAVTDYLESLRPQFADFQTITDRGLAMEDFGILDYQGSLAGVSLAEMEVELPSSLVGGERVWLKMEEKEQMPGFAAALIGMQPQEERNITIEFPQDYEQPDLAGKNVHYTVSLHEIKAQTIPELDDAFAAKIKPEATLDQLRVEVQKYLAEQLNFQYEQEKRQAILDQLLLLVSCDLPSSLLEEEIELAKKRLAQAAHQPDASQDNEASEEQARQAAERRVRSRLILEAIALEEKIEVSNEDLSQRVYWMSQQYGMPVDKLIKELKKNDALRTIQQEVLLEKALAHVAKAVN